MHQKGLECLIACYPNGLKRIKRIYQQEVLEIERKNTQGRRVIGVIRMKLKNYNNKKKEKHVNSVDFTQSAKNIVENFNEILYLDEPSMNPYTELESKRTKHKTTKDKMVILLVLSGSSASYH